MNLEEHRQSVRESVPMWYSVWSKVDIWVHLSISYALPKTENTPIGDLLCYED
jgi:hypothetical protein